MTAAAEREFLFAHIGAEAGGWQALHDRVVAALANWPQAQLVGSFMGLFGIGSHELLLLLSVPVGADPLPRLRQMLPDHLRILDGQWLRATARPMTDVALQRAGIYVFRWFDVRAADVDEVVSLSRTAWETFENTADYRSEPIGLFRFVPPADAATDRGRMLLLTWYDDLTSWERSRTPHPDAAANFRRRAALTLRTVAIATRLIGAAGSGG